MSEFFKVKELQKPAFSQQAACQGPKQHLPRKRYLKGNWGCGIVAHFHIQPVWIEEKGC